jgi:hypothetical protein
MISGVRKREDNLTEVAARWLLRMKPRPFQTGSTSVLFMMLFCFVLLNEVQCEYYVLSTADLSVYIRNVWLLFTL